MSTRGVFPTIPRRPPTGGLQEAGQSSTLTEVTRLSTGDAGDKLRRSIEAKREAGGVPLESGKRLTGPR